MAMTNKDSIRVVIATLAYRIEGQMHVLSGSRLTDALNSKAKDFFAITDAKLFDPKSGELLFETDYLAVNRDSIMVIFPL